jgi:hypothetical protein
MIPDARFSVMAARSDAAARVSLRLWFARLAPVHADGAVIVVEAGGRDLAILRRAAVRRLGAAVVNGELLGAIGFAGALGCGQRTFHARRIRRRRGRLAV